MIHLVDAKTCVREIKYDRDIHKSTYYKFIIVSNFLRQSNFKFFH